MSHRLPLSAAGFIAMLVLIVAGPRITEITRFFGPVAKPDPSTVLILPLRGDRVRGDVAARRLRDAWAEWRDLNVLSDIEVGDAVNGTTPPSLTAARKIARRLGAGTLVWGEVSPSDPSNRVKLELYDLSADKTPTARTYSLADENAPHSAFVDASLALLRAPTRPVTADGGDKGTHFFAAWKAYGAGHEALARWQLSEALKNFADAVTIDARFAAAHLWFAQVAQWTGADTLGGWKNHAARAALGGAGLSGRDSLLAQGLVSQANEQFPHACEAYRRLAQRDSADFVAWFGAGECQARDNLVVRSASPGYRWQFRSSYYSAVLAYQRAFKLAPQMHSLLSGARLESLLPTTPTVPRWGRDKSGSYFMAYPSLVADTIGFVPYPEQEFARRLPASAMATLTAALDRDVRIRRDLATEWVQLTPKNPDALEALADVLETRGDIGPEKEPTSAMAMVEQARAMAANPDQRVRLAATEVRLELKLGALARARILADSILKSIAAPTNTQARELAALAALTGKVGKMAEMIALTGFQSAGVEIPAQIQNVAASYFAHAALGVCDPILANTKRLLAQRVESYAAPERRAEFLSALETRPLSFSVPCTQGASALEIQSPGDPLYQIQQAFARHDFAAVRRGLQASQALRRGMRPGDVSLDYTYQEAWLRAAIGDPAGAASSLDRTLNAMSSWSAPALKDAAAMAATGRAMILRADLASSLGDPVTAKTWASSVLALWKDADPALESQLERMVKLVRVQNTL